MDQSSVNTILGVAAFVQALFTFVIAGVTIYYARLTHKLVEIQIDPEIELDIPVDVLTATSDKKVNITNYSGCNIVELVIRVSVPKYRGPIKVAYTFVDGTLLDCIDVLSWEKGLKSKESLRFDCSEYFRHAEESLKIQDLSSDALTFHTNVFFDISCRRKSDRKSFFFHERYQVFRKDDGELIVHRQESKTQETNKRIVLA